MTEMALFRPSEILQKYTDLDMKDLKDRGFSVVLLDIDNTIAVPNTGSCDETAERFIRDLQQNGFRVIIFSNNTEKRVKMFLRGLDVEYVCWALKPLPFSYRRICRQIGVDPSHVAVMGDQLLTDILGANLSGCYGIYCRQLQEQDSFMTSINRKLEKSIWRHVLHEKV